MELVIKSKLVAVRKTQKGSYRCTFVSEKQDIITSYIKNLNEEKITNLAKMTEKRFSIPEDIIMFYRDENKVEEGEE